MPHPEPENFQAAFDLYIQRPTRENAMILLRLVGDWMRKRELAMIGPTLAIFEVLNERNQFARNFLPRMFQKLAPKILRHYLKADRPGWNDYWMARWQLNRDNEAARQIHWRVAHLTPISEEWRMVIFTAKWMADSQRSQDPEFDAMMKWIEGSCEACRVGVPPQQPPNVPPA